MNKLKIKNGLCLLSFIVGIALFSGCDSNEEYQAQYSFIEPVQIVEVDADMKSFRIVLEWLAGERDLGCPYVSLDTENTTALHNVHFINHIQPPLMTIGDFTPMDDDRMFYRDVELLPEGITEDVSIFYYIWNVLPSNPYNVISRLEVILRPKASN